MQWVFLIIAGVSEVVWATAMKCSCGFSKLAPSIVTVVGYVISAIFLSLALKKIPLGTAYAMWTGFGIVGTSLTGYFMFNESISPQQAICILLIIVGICGLKLLAPAE